MSEKSILKQLSELRNQLTTQTNNNIFQKHGLTEKIVEFQKPVTDSLKENNKQVVNTFKAIDEKPKHDLVFPITEGSKKKMNNSFFILDTFDKNTGIGFFKLNHKPKRYGFVDPERNLTFFTADGELKINNPSEGLTQLLFNDEDHINLELVSDEDMIKYLDILKATGLNPGRSLRFRMISKKFENKPIIGRELLTLKGDGLKEDEFNEVTTNEVPVDLTNKNSIQLFQELSLLLAAKQAGNKNTLGKASIILDHLKNTKSITEKKYDKMLSKFSN